MNVCPEREEKIWLYLSEEMADGERKAFAGHMARCPSCRTEMRRSRNMLEKMKAAGQTPQLSPESANAMARAVLDRLHAETGSGGRRWLRWPRLVPALAAACALVFFVGIFTYRALDRNSQPPMMSGLQGKELEQLQDQDMELLLEFQTVHKIVQVLDTPPPEGQDIDNNDSASRNRIHAVEA